MSITKKKNKGMQHYKKKESNIRRQPNCLKLTLEIANPVLDGFLRASFWIFAAVLQNLADDLWLPPKEMLSRRGLVGSVLAY